MLQKKGNIWYVVLNYKKGGRWCKKWVSTRTQSLREARAVEKDLEYKASVGLIKVCAARDIPTLRQHLDKWLEVCIKPPSRKPATYENYVTVSKRVCRMLGDRKITQITTQDIDEYIKSELEHHISHTLIRTQCRILKSAFKTAISWRILSVNPMDAVTPPAATKSPSKAASVEDVHALLQTAMESDRPIDYVIIALGALCGLRRGEICGLEWNDVDLERHTLHIRHSMSRRENSTIEDGTFYRIFPGKVSSLVLDKVKTDDSEAIICIPDLAVEALRRMRTWQQRNRMLMGPCYRDRGLVCCFEDGRPCEPNWIYHALQRLLKSAGLPHMRVHDLRHTAATLLLLQGVDIKLVSHQLRHANVATTQNIYQHVTDQLARRSADAMDQLFSKEEKDVKHIL